MYLARAVSGIFLFAIGGTFVLSLFMAILSNPSQFGYEALADTIAVFVGMLVLAFGLYLIIESASRRTLLSS